MSNYVFPDLSKSCKRWHRSQVYSNITQTATSGKEVRIALWSGGRYKWDIEISLLDNTGTLNLATYANTATFFGARYGDWDSFLLYDIYDNSATNQAIATTDGVTTAFQLQRTFGYQTDFIYNVNTTVAPIVYLNGSVVNPSLYTIGQYTGLITFTTAPAAGESLSATFQYYFRVRYQASEIDFSTEVMGQWEVAKISLIETNV